MNYTPDGHIMAAERIIDEEIDIIEIPDTDAEDREEIASAVRMLLNERGE